MERPIHLIFLAFGVIIFCTACGKEQASPNPAPPSGPIGPTEPALRRVLLEDFTGHRCHTSPAATRTGLELVDQYGQENLIMVGLHVFNTFAAPYNGGPPGSYQTDFRTAQGTAYAQNFGIAFLPIGMVNRLPFGGSHLLYHESWGDAVGAIVGQPAAMDVRITSLSYIPGSNSVSTTMRVTAQEDLVGEHRLVVYLVEDQVIDWQLDFQAIPPDVPDYAHRNVLRGTVTDTWGDPVIDSSATNGTIIVRSYTHPLPGNVLTPSNCALVAYVYNTATDEVVQVTERKFVP